MDFQQPIEVGGKTAKQKVRSYLSKLDESKPNLELGFGRPFLQTVGGVLHFFFYVFVFCLFIILPKAKTWQRFMKT